MPITWDANGIKFDLNVAGGRTTYQNTVAFAAHTNVSPLSAAYPAGVNPAYPSYGSPGLNTILDYTQISISQWSASTLIAGTVYYNTTNRPVWIAIKVGREDGGASFHVKANGPGYQLVSGTGYLPFYPGAQFSWSTTVILIPAGGEWYYLKGIRSDANYPDQTSYTQFVTIVADGTVGSPV
jgi:hypothetical protein